MPKLVFDHLALDCAIVLVDNADTLATASTCALWTFDKLNHEGQPVVFVGHTVELDDLVRAEEWDGQMFLNERHEKEQVSKQHQPTAQMHC